MIFKKFLKVSLFLSFFSLFSCGQSYNTERSIVEEDSDSLVGSYSYNQIRYVALGDESSAGFFFGSNLQPHLGSFDFQKQNFSGASWPAFFAHYIRQIAPNSLTTFNNLSLLGVSVQDWLKALSSSKFLIGKATSTDFVEFSNRIKFLNGPFLTQRNFSLEDSENFYQETIDALSNANLITIQLGFHDLIKPFLEIFSDFKNFLKAFVEYTDKKPEFHWPEMVKKLLGVGEQLTQNLQSLIKIIRSYNSSAKIIVVGYSYNSLFLITSIFDEIIKRFTSEWKGKIIHTIYRILNQSLLAAAKEVNVGFINVFSEELWKDNDELVMKTDQNSKNLFLENFLDIFPSSRGNKWIAQQVFLKLSLSSDLISHKLSADGQTQRDKEYIENLGLGKNLNYAAVIDYLRKDNGAFEQLLFFNTPQKKRISKVLVDDFGRNNQLEIQLDLSQKIFPQLIPTKFIDFFNPTISEILLNTLVVLFSEKKEFNSTHEWVKDIWEKIELFLNLVPTS